MNVTLRVTGMNCGHCVAALTRELSGVPGLSSLAVEVGLARFEAAEPFDETSVRAAVEEAGFSVAAVERAPA